MTPQSSHTSTIFILISCIGMFALGQFHRAAGAVFGPVLVTELALDPTEISTLVSAIFLATIIVQIPLGAALDRFGAHRLLPVSLTITALGTCGFAMASGYWTALSARYVLGAGLAASGAGIYVLIAQNFPQRSFGYYNGMTVTIGGVGGLLGTYPLALAFSHWGWRSVIFAVGILSLALALFVFASTRAQPAPKPANTSAPTLSYLGLLKNSDMRRVLILATMTFAPITVITGLWGGPYFQTIQSLSPQTTGGILFVLFFATILGGLSFGLIDRIFHRRRAVILVSLMTSTSTYACLALLPTPSAAPATLLFFGMVFAQHFYIPLSAHMRNIVPADALGRASTLFLLTAVAAIPVFQWGYGFLLEWGPKNGFDQAQSYRLAFGATATVMIIAGLIYMPAKKRPRRSGQTLTPLLLHPVNFCCAKRPNLVNFCL